MFLKEKQDIKIKGQNVAGVNKQRTYIPKGYASSSTVATYFILLTIIINAEENRDIDVIDIPNTFIQTRVKKKNDVEIINLLEVLVGIL